MASIPADTMKQAFFDQLTEAWEGPPGPYPWFVSGTSDVGLIDTLRGLSAEQASREVGEPPTTIAAHAGHLRWSLAYANAFFRGETPRPDWPASWNLKTVDEAGWNALLDSLSDEYRTLRNAIEAHEDWSDTMLVQGTVALLPHSAYHLGAIRQMVKVLVEA